MLEGPPQGHDVMGWTVRQVRERPGLDLAVFPVGLAKQDATMGNLPRRCLGQDFCNIHDYYNRGFLSCTQMLFDTHT